MHRGHLHENKENRAFNRIMRKLSDMGFTEGAYPKLTGKVMDQLLSHPPVTKDAEDDVVTNLIEELVSSGGAQAGGSGGIPGAWH
jgi:Wiskott-Aldrich syndrome protein